MPRRLPPLNALRAFEAAARLGRMHAAADELCVTPGAISRQVQQLEDCLKVPLFQGSKNKPELTAAGQALFPVLSAALDQIEAGVRAIRNTGATGTLDVSCYSTFTVKWLIPRLFDFHAQHPEIEIRLQATGTNSSTDSAPCDVVITVEAPSTAPSTPQTTPLFAEHLGVVLAPSLAEQAPLHTPADLNHFTLLNTQTRNNAWSMWALAAGCEAPTASGPVFEHYYFTLQAAAGGLGVAVAPWHLVADDVQAGRLLAPFGFCASGLQYLAKQQPAASAKGTIFCTWLKAQAQASSTPPPCVLHASS
jgi:LysR family transcriptional regulator, glycine cleavage system transcriptional activator